MISRLMSLAAIVAIAAVALPACSSNKCCCRPSSSAVSSAPAPIPAMTTTPVVNATQAPADDTVSMSAKYARPGFAVYEQDGRLWVFDMDSEHHDEFRRVGEPAKSVTKIGVGPNGMTVRGAESDVVDSYVAAVKYGRPGFAVFEEDGRVWVFKLGSEGLDQFLNSGEPAKSVTKIGVGPDGKSIRWAYHLNRYPNQPYRTQNIQSPQLQA